MTAPLTPSLALAYLQELSVDVRAAAVFGPDGQRLVGDGHLADRAHALLSHDANAVVVDGSLLVARTSNGGGLALIAGDLALLPLLKHDLVRVAEALSDQPETRDSP